MNTYAIRENESHAAFTTSRPLSCGMDLNIDLRWVVRLLLVVIAVLVVTATIDTIIKHHLQSMNQTDLVFLLNRFDLGFEPSIPNWYSSISLLACSVLLTVIARAKAHSGDRWVGTWRMMAVLIAVLAVGKGVRLNEIVNEAVYRWVDSKERFFTPWMIPAVILVALAVLWIRPFWKSLDRRTAIQFFIAGSIFILGNVGMDSIGGAVADQYGSDSIRYCFAQGVEELMEMLGVLVFLHALLDYIARNIGEVRVRIA